MKHFNIHEADGFSLSQADLADYDFARLANDAEDMNRAYSTITSEQADDLSRVLVAVKAMLGRID